MNQERIGKFIARCRKEKKITQSELSEKLRVTDRAVSNWETGKNMPDLSLFHPLCQILDITINELLSGERLNKEKYQEKFEENIVNTIEYSTKKLNEYNITISLIILVFGLFITLSAIMIFPSESSWSSIYSIFGLVIFTYGIKRFINKNKFKLIILMATFFGALGILIFTDYINVLNNEEAPMFRLTTTTTGNVIYYDTLFYDVYRCNFDREDEYWVIEKNRKLSIEDLINYCK